MEVVPYIRLRDKDQSSDSIDNQLREITNYCNKGNLTQTKAFFDNGESFYTFDRAAFKMLEFISKRAGSNTLSFTT